MTKSTWSTWGLRLAAVAIAFLVWLHAVTEHTYTTEASLPLVVEDPVGGDARASEVIVSGAPPATVQVRVTGSGKELLKLDRDAFVLRLWAQGEAGTSRTYRLTPDLVEKRADDLEVQVVDVLEPRELELRLDRRQTRTLPVRPSLEILTREPYVQVGPTRVEPSSATITGPREQLAQVTHLTTEQLVLTDVQDDVVVDLPLVPPLDIRCSIDPPLARLSADIQILAQDDLSRVPVTVRGSASRTLRAEPRRVRVRVKGGIDIIANLDPETDISLFVDYSSYAGEPLPVQHDPVPEFSVIEIVPAAVDVVEP